MGVRPINNIRWKEFSDKLAWAISTSEHNTYGVSPNGWMDTDIFFESFKRFAEQVRERPLLLIYDGHLSHVSIILIEEAIKLLKLPPHVTDMLQPLDVCGFGPLKREWEKLLNERMNTLGPREPISKSVFVDLLAKECLVCELRAGNKRLFFSQTVDQFSVFKQKWQETIVNINNCSPFIFLYVGDFNARNSDWWEKDIRNTQGIEIGLRSMG